MERLDTLSDQFDGDRLNEIVDLMLETVCTRRKTIRIAGDDYPAELVKAKFMKLDAEHIRFVLDCMKENTKFFSFCHFDRGSRTVQEIVLAIAKTP